MQEIFRSIEKQGVDKSLIKRLEQFRHSYEAPEKVRNRIMPPMMHFYGKEVLEMAIAGLLEGENLLLCGPKATGKNILAENLAYLFGRPVYNISFHVNTDSSTLIGTDTFQDNEVKLRKGPVYQCARYGGFGILDEINMAKMMRFLSCMRHWITDGSSTCRDMTRLICIRPHGLSEP